MRAHFQKIPNTLQQPNNQLWSLSLSPRQAESRGSLPVLVAIHDPWHDRVGIGARADQQENHQDQ